MQITPHMITAIASSLLASCWVTLGFRLYVRGFMIKSLGVDDYVIAAACVTFLGFCFCELFAVTKGYGKHISGPGGINNTANAEKALMGFYFGESFYALTTSLLKISVGFFLLRIAATKWQVWVIKFFLVGAAICGSVYYLLILNQCRPISYWWNLNPDVHGKCINALTFAIATWVISLLNSAADLTYAVIPMILVATNASAMDIKTRIMVCVLLGMASTAGIVTIVRFPYLHALNKYKGDFTYETANVAALATLEIGIGITAANLATMRPLIVRWRRNMTRNTAGEESMPDYPATIGGGAFRVAKGSTDTKLLFQTTVSQFVIEPP